MALATFLRHQIVIFFTILDWAADPTQFCLWRLIAEAESLLRPECQGRSEMVFVPHTSS